MYFQLLGESFTNSVAPHKSMLGQSLSARHLHAPKMTLALLVRKFFPVMKPITVHNFPVTAYDDARNQGLPEVKVNPM